jgi:hypothetical protein
VASSTLFLSAWHAVLQTVQDIEARVERAMVFSRALAPAHVPDHDALTAVMAGIGLGFATARPIEGLVFPAHSASIRCRRAWQGWERNEHNAASWR